MCMLSGARPDLFLRAYPFDRHHHDDESVHPIIRNPVHFYLLQPLSHVVCCPIRDEILDHNRVALRL